MWASTREELFERLNVIAERCKTHRVVLSKKKCVIGSTLPFAGYIISDNGIKPDPDRAVALRKFPTPKDTTGVKSFMGLANQLSFFIPDFAHNTKCLRGLMGKGKVFQWLPEHQFEFQSVKAILSSNLLNHHFDIKKPIELLTDASRQNGLGYALCQRGENNQIVIVTCGSKSLTPTQQRYATIELECLAIILGH